MVKIPFLRRFAIGFTVVLGSVIAHDTLWDAMFREHLLCGVNHCLATQWEVIMPVEEKQIIPNNLPRAIRYFMWLECLTLL